MSDNNGSLSFAKHIAFELLSRSSSKLVKYCGSNCTNHELTGTSLSYVAFNTVGVRPSKSPSSSYVHLLQQFPDRRRLRREVHPGRALPD